MRGAVVNERPWLGELGYESPEWGRFGELQAQRMPGMFGNVGTPDYFIDTYYDMFPTQKRMIRNRFGLADDTDIADWARENADRIAQEMPYGLWGELPPKPTQMERYRVEQAFTEWQMTGQWDAAVLDQYYGNQESGKTKFWNAMGGYVLNDSVYDDPVLKAMFSDTSRDALQFTDEQYLSALKYFTQHQSKFVDNWAMKILEEHPEWKDLVDAERGIVQSSTAGDLWEIYNALPTPNAQRQWREENADKWSEMTDSLATANLSKIQAPHWLYIHDNEKYQQWFGDVSPDDLDVKSAVASYRQASADLERSRDTGEAWTPEMERWFGATDTRSSSFWDYYFANRAMFTDEYREDPVVMAALSSDVRGLIKSDAMGPVYEEALRRLKGYYDVDQSRRWQAYPALRGQASNERSQFLAQFNYDLRPTDKSGENAWWDSREGWMKGHPVMVYFYYYENYIKWWGNVPPNEISLVPSGASAEPSSPTPSSGGGYTGGGDEGAPPVGPIPELPPIPTLP
jgi:hypothetical protein